MGIAFSEWPGPLQDMAGLSSVPVFLVGSGHTGQTFADAAKMLAGDAVQATKRGGLQTFAAIPRRRMVVPFAWLEKCRRLWKTPERLPNTNLQVANLAFLALLLKRCWTDPQNLFRI
jgi:hypothetical protein